MRYRGVRQSATLVVTSRSRGSRTFQRWVDCGATVDDAFNLRTVASFCCTWVLATVAFGTFATTMDPAQAATL
jgi:hypothetical protein